jgi:hypothetical protein
MIRLTIVYLIAVSLLGPFISQAFARGRSFPIEVTGVIMAVNKSDHTFVIQVDHASAVLMLAVGRDCKFTQNGAPADENILQKGARMRVSYFSTIFSGKVAVEIESSGSNIERH